MVLIQFAVIKYIYSRNKFERYHSEILTKSYWSRILWSLARTTSQLWLLHNFYLLPASSLLQHFLCFFFLFLPFYCRTHRVPTLLWLFSPPSSPPLGVKLVLCPIDYGVKLVPVSNWCWYQIVHQSIYPIG